VSWGKGGTSVSQQLLDRGQGPDGHGGNFDLVVADQIGEQLRASMDLYTIQQSLNASTGVVTNNSALTTTSFYANVQTAAEQLADQAGTALQATHTFSTSNVAGWVRKQVDSENRPIWLPDVDAVIAAEPQGQPFTTSGWQGIIIPGGGGYYIDDNLPANSSNQAQVVVVNAPSIIVFKAPVPVINCFPQASGAANLSVSITARQYLAVLAKFSNGIQVISGSGYFALS
jgi:hypothetical protein